MTDAKNFKFHLERDNGEDDVTQHVLDLYDMAVNSMDYGSGMLDSEQYKRLADLAEMIDADDKLDVTARYKQESRVWGNHMHDFDPDRPEGQPGNLERDDQ